MVRMKQGWITVRGVWSDHPAIDWVLVAVIVTVHAAVTGLGPQVMVIVDLPLEDRMRVYTTVASVSALIFGFATASIAFFYGAAKGDRVDLMKRVMGPQLVASWRGALSGPLVAVAACIIAIIGDTAAEGLLLFAGAVEIGVLLLAVRAIRLRWLFTSTLTLMAFDAQNPAPTPVATPGLRPAARPGRKSDTA